MMPHGRKRFVVSIVCAGILVWWMVARFSAKASLMKYRQAQVMMSTDIVLDTCIDPNQQDKVEEVYQKVWDRLAEIAWRMNVYDDRSDVAQMNGSFQHPVSIEADTVEVIEKAVEYNRSTGGAFDVTVWPLIKLWKKAQKDQTYPDQASLAAVLQSTGGRQIAIDDQKQVQLLHPKTMIDLGGIAKGYAIDEAARIFRENGIEHFYIDAGGDVYVGGQNCLGEPWHIGIRDPRDKEKILDVLKISNMAVTTSGNYERYYEIEGRRFSHIIDPRTGYPQEHVISATVIAPKAIDADALSTALTVLGEKEGVEMIEKDFTDAQAMVIKRLDSGALETFVTSGYPRFQLN